MIFLRRFLRSTQLPALLAAFSLSVPITQLRAEEIALSPDAKCATETASRWPQFRGPDGLSLVSENHIPTEWSAEKNIAWKIAIPGTGWACPIVWEDKIFIATAVTENQPKPKAGGGRGPGGFGREGGGPGREGGGPGGPDRAPGGDGPRPERGATDGAQADGERPAGGNGPGGEGRPRRGRGGPGGGGRDNAPPQSVYRWELLCLDAKTGKEIWKKVALERKPTIPTHSTNTYASETPVTDGKHIFVYFGMIGLFCFDFDGNIVWQKDLGSYPMMNGWGTGSSPVLVDDHLVIQCDNEEKSFIVALDKKTGEEAWRKPRDEKSTWSTPFVWKHHGQTDIVALGGTKVVAYDPASGKETWELPGIGARCSSSPAATDDVLIFGGGGGMRGSGPLLAINTKSVEGPSPKADIAWKKDNAGPPMASPLLYDGYVYVLEQRGGMISCHDAKTGEPAYYRQRLADARGFTSSPWASDGKIFCLDQDGKTYVIEAGPKFKLVGVNELDEMCWSSPAIAHDSLYLRTVDHLYCIRNQ